MNVQSFMTTSEKLKFESRTALLRVLARDTSMGSSSTYFIEPMEISVPVALILLALIFSAVGAWLSSKNGVLNRYLHRFSQF